MKVKIDAVRECH